MLPVPGVEQLSLLPAGPVPPNPAELLNSSRAQDMFEPLRERFDLVLIDSPPVLPVTDAAILSRYADATLMLAAAGQTRRGDLHRAAEKLSQVGADDPGHRAEQGDQADRAQLRLLGTRTRTRTRTSPIRRASRHRAGRPPERERRRARSQPALTDFRGEFHVGGNYQPARGHGVRRGGRWWRNRSRFRCCAGRPSSTCPVTGPPIPSRPRAAAASRSSPGCWSRPC